MKTLRLAVSIALIFLIVGGYAASQLAAMNGNLPEYYAKIDQPPLHALQLILLLVAITLGLIPDKEERANPLT